MLAVKFKSISVCGKVNFSPSRPTWLAPAVPQSSSYRSILPPSFLQRNSQLPETFCPSAQEQLEFCSLSVHIHMRVCVCVFIYTCLGINNTQLLLPSAHNKSLCLRELDLLVRHLRPRGHTCASVPLRINSAKQGNTVILCASVGRCYCRDLFLASPVRQNTCVVMLDCACAVRTPHSHVAIPRNINSFTTFGICESVACLCLHRGPGYPLMHLV